MKTPEEKAAYYKGKYDALKEKMSDTGSIIKQSIIDHTVRYVIIGLIVVGGAFGTYYYVSHKVTETVTEIKKDVKDSIPHPVEATKKWLKKDHWWNSKDENETSEMIIEKHEVSEVIVEEEVEVIQDEKKTDFFASVKNKWNSWRKKDEDNKTKE
jgi:hypothetical protein